MREKLSADQVLVMLLKMVGWPDGNVSAEHRDNIADVCSDYLALSEELREAERRMRWIYSTISRGAGYECCNRCDSIRMHFQECLLFEEDGTPKPTPEDFK